eukprot:m.1384296 g.1384296  ORF g.1384296 m.1384296 type:complete len:2410 (+) comp24974_c0_seq3:273-7502(+)
MQRKVVMMPFISMYILGILAMIAPGSMSSTSIAIQSSSSVQVDGAGFSRTPGNTVAGFSAAVGVSSETVESNPQHTGIDFNISSRTHVLAGFTVASSVPTSSTALPIQYALELTRQGQVLVVQNFSRLAIVASYPGDQILRFSVYFTSDGRVQYAMDGSVLFTSTAVVHRPATIGTQALFALFSTSDTIDEFLWATRSHWCFDVGICAPDACQTSAACFEGACMPTANATDGTSCTDDDITTVNDTCVAGVCVGVDPCAGITCPASDSCHDAGQCVRGLCYAGNRRDDGTPCDDLDATTVGDVCQGGVCVGVVVTTPAVRMSTSTRDACAGVTCPQPDTCHAPFQCAQGVCFIGDALPDGTACDDGDDVTTGDTCTAGACIGTDPCAGVSCPASTNPCITNVSCVAGTCVSTTALDRTSCDDSNPSTVGDQCFSGVCVGVDPCIGVTCPLPPAGDCFVRGTCFPGRLHGAWRGICTSPLAPAGIPCDDGNVNTVNDTCSDEGFCLGIDQCRGVTCAPVDECHAPGTCFHGVCAIGDVLSGIPCDDHNISTGNDTCTASGTCVGVDLCIGVECSTAECFESSRCVNGRCITGAQFPDFAACDDGNAETHSDVCIDGVCGGTNFCTGVTCPTDAADTCTVQDSGVCRMGVCHYTDVTDGTFCDDGDNKTLFDACTAGVCAGVDLCVENNITCPPPPLCHAAVECLHGLCPEYEPLDDLTPCSFEDCCDDLPENASLVCRAGSCVPEYDCVGVVCDAPSQCHAPPACAVGYPPATRCSVNFAPSLADGALCDDGNNATLFDVCVQTSPLDATCQGVDLCEGLTCPPTSQCHADATCFRGVCDPEPAVLIGAECDDNQTRTVNDTCMASGVCAGVDQCETDAVACPNRTCFDSLGCTFAVCQYDMQPDGTTCTDDNPATIDDACVAGTCVGVFPDLCANVTCPAPTNCHGDGVCNQTTGACMNSLLPAESPCSDGSTGTYADMCLSGVCVGLLPCTGPCVAFPAAPGLQETLLYGLERVQATGVLDVTATSLNSVRFNDTYVGVEFQPVAGNETLVAGLTRSSAIATHEDITYGLMLTRSSVLVVIERGVWQAGAGAYTAGDVLGVRINATGGVEYVRNGAFVHYSTAPAAPTEHYRVAVSIFSAGSEIAHLRRVSPVALCTGMVCPTAGQCERTAPCSRGLCAPVVAVPNGLVCDDGDNRTSFDACVDGVCSGTDLCVAHGVVCTPASPCELPPTCFQGLCATDPVFLPVNTSCDDGNATTVDDKCSSTGVCVGVDPCLDVVCPFPSDLHPACAQSPVCVGGACVPGPLALAGTACDDGLARTDDDVCNGAGVCVGTDYCANVTCVPHGPCMVTSACVRGVCDVTYAAAGTACDDSDPRTAGDVCGGGSTCAGVDPCLNTTCAEQSCREASCLLGNCSYALSDEVTGCDDGDPMTRFDECDDAGECLGYQLHCESAVASSDVTFAPSCTEAPGVLNSTDGIRWALSTATTAPSNACACYTTSGAQQAVVTSPPVLTDSQCARLLCSGGSFFFNRCVNNGREVATGTWDMEERFITVPLAYEDVVCFGNSLPPLPSTTTAATTTAIPTTVSARPRDNSSCTIVLTTVTATPSVCEIFAGQAVRWVWTDAPLNVIPATAASFPSSGLPALQGEFIHVFDDEGLFEFTTTIFRTVRGLVDVVRAVEEVDPATLNTSAIAVLWDERIANTTITAHVGQNVGIFWIGTVLRSVASGQPGDKDQGMLFRFGREPTDNAAFAVRFLVADVFAVFDPINPAVRMLIDVVEPSTSSVLTSTATTQTSVTATTRTTTTTVTTMTDVSTTPRPPPCTSPNTVIGASGEVFDGTSALVGTVGNRDASNFTVFIKFTPTDTPSGYLFAKSNLAGSRYYSLYLRRSPPRLYFYHRIAGSSVQRFFYVPAALSIGIEYRCRVTVSGLETQLELSSALFDYGVFRHTLAGPLDDCGIAPGADCIFLTGARANLATGDVTPAGPVWPAGSIRFTFTGTIALLQQFEGCDSLTLAALIAASPTAPATTDGHIGATTATAVVTTTAPATSAPCFNLLGALSPLSGPSVVGGAVVFDGSAGRVLTRAHPPFVAGAAGTFAVAVTATVASGDSGYLFAKTNGDGAVRYYSMYTSAVTDQLRLYYRSGGRTRAVVFAVDISDGRPHAVVLNIVGLSVLLQVDASVFRARLAGSVEDCSGPSPDCVFILGARSTTSSRGLVVRGTMQYAQLCTTSIVSIPARAATEAYDLLQGHYGETLNPTLGGYSIDAPPAVGPVFTIAAVVQASSPGYILAKSSSTFSLVYGIHIDSLGLRFEFEGALGFTESLSFSGTNFTSGARHEVFVAANGATLIVGIDGTTSSQSLSGPISDCHGTALCELYVGQSPVSPGVGNLGGMLHSLVVVNNTAWTQWVSPL